MPIKDISLLTVSSSAEATHGIFSRRLKDMVTGGALNAGKKTYFSEIREKAEKATEKKRPLALTLIFPLCAAR